MSFLEKNSSGTILPIVGGGDKEVQNETFYTCL